MWIPSLRSKVELRVCEYPIIIVANYVLTLLLNNIEISFQTYKENLQRLRTMVLVKFTNDTIVKPTETEMFGFYKPGQGSLIQTLEQSDLYREV